MRGYIYIWLGLVNKLFLSWFYTVYRIRMNRSKSGLWGELGAWLSFNEIYPIDLPIRSFSSAWCLFLGWL